MRTGICSAGYGAWPQTKGEDAGNGSGLNAVAVAGPYHRSLIGEGHSGSGFRDLEDHSPAREGGIPDANKLTARLVPAYLRLAVGIPELVSSLDKFQHLPAFVALWHKLHLPAAEILAPAYAAAELFGALLLLAGWQTRIVALLFVAELLAEILLAKRLVRPAGWMLEWQSLWVVLILARIGAGRWSLDWLSFHWRSGCRRGHNSPANR